MLPIVVMDSGLSPAGCPGMTGVVMMAATDSHFKQPMTSTRAFAIPQRRSRPGCCWNSSPP